MGKWNGEDFLEEANPKATAQYDTGMGAGKQGACSKAAEGACAEVWIQGPQWRARSPGVHIVDLLTAVYVTWAKSFSCSVPVSPGVKRRLLGALLGMLLKSCPPSSTALSQFCILGNVSESRKHWCQCSLVPRATNTHPSTAESWGRSGSPTSPPCLPLPLQMPRG